MQNLTNHKLSSCYGGADANGTPEPIREYETGYMRCVQAISQCAVDVISESAHCRYSIEKTDDSVSIKVSMAQRVEYYETVSDVA